VIVNLKNSLMKNVDIEIYISNLIKFFESNPNDLMSLVGEAQKEEFYKKLREVSEDNFRNNQDYVLTRQQMVDIIIDLKVPELKNMEDPQEVVESYIQKTKWGDIILN
jgi:hypothetical protein